ncbi:MAG TPA: ATP-binding protein [Candidatus Methylomirabilis sp.]|nr:ATP-binding protein [Candidatus Methylomirabilis sp.]
MRLGVRQKLVLLSVAVMVIISFGFAALSLRLSRGWVEDDLKDRAIAFAREIAATIGDRREFESGTLLQDQIRQILAIRQNVSQLDILAFEGTGAVVVATSHPDRRLPFSRDDLGKTRKGNVVSRLIERDRYWEVMAPIRLAGAVVGAVACRFSLERPDRLASRIRIWALTLTAASVVVMGFLMSLAIQQVVDRPIRRFVNAIAGIRAGNTAAVVQLRSADEFGVMAQHFNEMMARVNQFSDELQRRVKEAVAELDQRYHEVQSLNAELFEMQRRLSHAERLAVSGRIMAQVAHEIGTPLHSVAGHLELLRKELPADGLTEEAARRMGIIETQLGRVSEIITQLLDLTRRSAGSAAPVDVNRLVREAVELVRPGMSAAGLRFQVSQAADLPRVHGHAGQLQQVILNLLTNAMDATPPRGLVEVKTRAASGRGEVVIEVRDDGHGIAPDHRKQIFEPFFSTKAPGKGSGLGLFISSQIVRDHQGRIDVESEPGHGTTFRVILPARDRA